MSEAEFDRLIDAVRTAIAPSDFIERPQAANDNEGVWLFIPFPEHDYPAQFSPAPIAGNVDFLELLLGRIAQA